MLCDGPGRIRLSVGRVGYEKRCVAALGVATDATLVSSLEHGVSGEVLLEAPILPSCLETGMFVCGARGAPVLPSFPSFEAPQDRPSRQGKDDRSPWWSGGSDTRPLPAGHFYGLWVPPKAGLVLLRE